MSEPEAAADEGSAKPETPGLIPGPRGGFLRPPFKPGENAPGGGVHRRGPDKQPRRIVRSIILRALCEAQRRNGQPVQSAMLLDLIAAMQKIARRGAVKASGARDALRLMELVAEQIDGRVPQSPPITSQRITEFIYAQDIVTEPPAPEVPPGEYEGVNGE